MICASSFAIANEWDPLVGEWVAYVGLWVGLLEPPESKQLVLPL